MFLKLIVFATIWTVCYSTEPITNKYAKSGLYDVPVHEYFHNRRSAKDGMKFLGISSHETDIQGESLHRGYLHLGSSHGGFPHGDDSEGNVSKEIFKSKKDLTERSPRGSFSYEKTSHGRSSRVNISREKSSRERSSHGSFLNEKSSSESTLQSDVSSEISQHRITPHQEDEYKGETTLSEGGTDAESPIDGGLHDEISNETLPVIKNSYNKGSHKESLEKDLHVESFHSESSNNKDYNADVSNGSSHEVFSQKRTYSEDSLHGELSREISENKNGFHGGQTHGSSSHERFSHDASLHASISQAGHSNDVSQVLHKKKVQQEEQNGKTSHVGPLHVKESVGKTLQDNNDQSKKSLQDVRTLGDGSQDKSHHERDSPRKGTHRGSLVDESHGQVSNGEDTHRGFSHDGNIHGKSSHGGSQDGNPRSSRGREKYSQARGLHRKESQDSVSHTAKHLNGYSYEGYHGSQYLHPHVSLGRREIYGEKTSAGYHIYLPDPLLEVTCSVKTVKGYQPQAAYVNDGYYSIYRNSFKLKPQYNGELYGTKSVHQSHSQNSCDYGPHADPWVYDKGYY